MKYLSNPMVQIRPPKIFCFEVKKELNLPRGRLARCRFQGAIKFSEGLLFNSYQIRNRYTDLLVS